MKSAMNTATKTLGAMTLLEIMLSTIFGSIKEGLARIAAKQ